MAFDRFEAVAVVVLFAAFVADQNDDDDCNHEKGDNESGECTHNDPNHVILCCGFFCLNRSILYMLL